MSVFRRPLVALSLTEPDVQLLRYARQVVGLGAEHVRFVHVIASETVRPSPAQIDHAREHMRAEVVAHFGDTRVTVEFDVLHGSRLDELLTMAIKYESDLILLGHRRDRSGHRSLARRLAMVAPCSVWMVPEDSPEQFVEILVPIDFSRHSADALSMATAIAAQRGLSRCRALHVYFDPSTVRYPEHVTEVQGREEAALEQFVALVERHGIAVDICLEESSHVAHAILRVARTHGSDLIVMSTLGRSRASAILLGSVTSKTMEETRVPVLAVKHFGSRMSVLQAILHQRHEDRIPKTN